MKRQDLRQNNQWKVICTGVKAEYNPGHSFDKWKFSCFSSSWVVMHAAGWVPYYRPLVSMQEQKKHWGQRPGHVIQGHLPIWELDIYWLRSSGDNTFGSVCPPVRLFVSLCSPASLWKKHHRAFISRGKMVVVSTGCASAVDHPFNTSELSYSSQLSYHRQLNVVKTKYMSKSEKLIDMPLLIWEYIVSGR